MDWSNPMSEAPDTAVVEAQEVTREFHRGSEAVGAVRGISLSVQRGETLAIMGPSGSGKSTLLCLLGGLDDPSSGCVLLDGRDLATCSRTERAILRREAVGFILQNPSLLPMLTVRENIELPLSLARTRPGTGSSLDENRVLELLEQVGLLDKMNALPEELSGGQQQRVAVARALAARPHLLLADEPAGSLDTATANSVLGVIARAVEHDGISLVLVTHERDDTRFADRVIYLRDGRIDIGRNVA
jgi:putative ABC transport system ATP-binding protein